MDRDGREAAEDSHPARPDPFGRRRVHRARIDPHDEWAGRLGKHRTGKSCLYLNRLGDVDVEVLRELVDRSVATMKLKYPDS
jgi:hypothetical protein